MFFNAFIALTDTISFIIGLTNKMTVTVTVKVKVKVTVTVTVKVTVMVYSTLAHHGESLICFFERVLHVTIKTLPLNSQ